MLSIDCMNVAIGRQELVVDSAESHRNYDAVVGRAISMVLGRIAGCMAVAKLDSKMVKAKAQAQPAEHYSFWNLIDHRKL